ncbi:JmjC domain [Trypanosoma melophagium]|uniref:JmjC domain n=1 Tax=Trypanosoma melophagium TaxID=715481 RepID=UPI00351A779B|nr:JmjC domain [Trypanosoma melophagium]
MLELDGRTLTFDQFRECCLEKNFPAIIRQAVRNGEGRESKKGGFFSPINEMKKQLMPEGLIKTFGAHHLVPTTVETVADGSLDDSSSNPSVEFGIKTLDEVMECWRSNEKILYLKNWHMQSDVESILNKKKSNKDSGNLKYTESQSIVHADGLYRVPDYLGDDWMDEFCRCSTSDETNYSFFGDEKSDYRFVYIGPPNSWTPLHFDVFGTYSWSLNVCGEKLWFFPSPEGNEHLLESGLHGLTLAPDIRTTTGAELWTVHQYPGDLVFVPSGYLHQVHNINGPRFTLKRKNIETSEVINDTEHSALNTDDSVALVISINHNWCNEWCIEKMVKAFCRDANRLQYMLTDEDRLALFGDDIVAWHEHVEHMLVCGTNWSFASIRSFLKYRLNHLKKDHYLVSGKEMSVRHILERCLDRINTLELNVTHHKSD